MSSIPVAAGVHYRRADEHLHDVDDLSLDLLDLASAAYVVDRGCRRGRVGSETWSRDLHFTFEARRPMVWRHPEVRARVLGLLSWLTSDTWKYDVYTRPADASAVQLSLPIDAPGREVVLFSGGLDSTAGAALLLSSGTPVLGVAVATNGRMRGYQARVTRALQDVEGWDLEVRPHGMSVVREHSGDEKTRRTRGLLFLASGFVNAVAAGRQRLLVLENGVGAINLGYTAAYSGCMTSRGAHPRTLDLAADLFSLVRGEPFEIVNPHLCETKAQMLGRLPDHARAACQLSESCDSAASARGLLASRCGACSSCLLRRMSLGACRRSDWDGRAYLADIANPGHKSMRPEMLWQAGRLARAMAASDALDVLMREFPDLRDVDCSVLPLPAVVNLYASYVREWSSDPHPLVRRFLPAPDVAA